MKKKIILLLCFIMLTVILTGCSSITIDEAEIEKMTEIADHVANEKGYKLPEGYKVSYENETTNARICISKRIESGKVFLDITFDISGEETKFTEMEIQDFSMMYSVWTYIIVILAAIGCIILAILISEFLQKIDKKLKKVNSKLKKRIVKLKEEKENVE